MSVSSSVYTVKVYHPKFDLDFLLFDLCMTPKGQMKISNGQKCYFKSIQWIYQKKLTLTLIRIENGLFHSTIPETM